MQWSLGSVVFAPDVEHEDAGDEEERHHQDRHWPHLGERREMRLQLGDQSVVMLTLIPGESSV